MKTKLVRDLLVGGVLLAASLAWATPPFGVPQVYPVGERPQGCIVADFNTDGWLDVATANAYGKSVSVLLGQPGGSLGGRQDYVLAPSSYHDSTWGVVTADYNGDGHLDLAATNKALNRLDVLYGQGNGTFGSAVSFSAGLTPFKIAGADLNKDGRPDVAVSNFNQSQVSVLYGLPGGGFSSPAAYATGSQAQDAVAADLNADGRLDLAVACYSGHCVTVWYGQPGGGFGGRIDLPSQYPSGLLAADLNQDGKLELAAANDYWALTVTVFAQQANGALALAQQLTTHNCAMGLTNGDFNNDGRQDLALAMVDGNDGHPLELHYGQPDGSLGPLDLYGQYRGTAYGVLAADFDKNGGLDLAIAGMSSIWILNNTTPEPATLSLLALGALALLRRKRASEGKR